MIDLFKGWDQLLNWQLLLQEHLLRDKLLLTHKACSGPVTIKLEIQFETEEGKNYIHSCEPFVHFLRGKTHAF